MLNGRREQRRVACSLLVLFSLVWGVHAADASAAGLTVLQQIDQRSAWVHDRVAPAVVAIQVRDGQPGMGYYGAGVVVSATGLVLTSSTVVPRTAQGVQVFFTDGRIMEAQVVDVADAVEACVLRVVIPPGDAGKALPFAEISDSSKTHVGDLAYTAGNPFHTISRDGQVAWSMGAVSGLYGLVSRDEESRYAGPVLETDAAVNPGSDGGPLLDADGRVLGILSLSFCESRWLGTAIPVHLIKKALPTALAGVPLVDTRSAAAVGSKPEARAASAVPEAFNAAVHKAEAALVKLRVERTGAEATRASTAARRQRQRPAGPVTGVLIDCAGYVLTSAYNVDGDVKNIDAQLADGSVFPAKVVGRNLALDLAVLKLVGATPRQLCPALEPESRPQLRAGRFVAVLGASEDNPAATRTTGIVSALGRFEGAAVQTDARINYGNCGGAVVDLHGRLVGIATHVKPGADWSQQNCGVGFFTPSDQILNCLSALESGQEVKAPLRAFLGVSPLEGAEEVNGVQVDDVIAGSAADKAKLRAHDVIVAIDGTDTHSWVELVRLLKTHKPGDGIQITYQRGHETSKVQTVLSTRQEAH